MSDFELRTRELPNGGISVTAECDFQSTADEFVNHVMREIDEYSVEQVSERLHALGWEKVVRCRDCKHYRENINGCAEFGDEWNDEYANVEPNGFCAWGVRKEG